MRLFNVFLLVGVCVSAKDKKKLELPVTEAGGYVKSLNFMKLSNSLSGLTDNPAVQYNPSQLYPKLSAFVSVQQSFERMFVEQSVYLKLRPGQIPALDSFMAQTVDNAYAQNLAQVFDLTAQSSAFQSDLADSLPAGLQVTAAQEKLAHCSNAALACVGKSSRECLLSINEQMRPLLQTLLVDVGALDKLVDVGNGKVRLSDSSSTHAIVLTLFTVVPALLSISPFLVGRFNKIELPTDE